MWLAMGGADHRSLPAPVTPAALVSIVPETTTMPPPETAAPIATPRLPLHEDDRQARNLVERWRQAWATRNVDAYLGSYSADFSPAKGQTHANWAAARRAKLLAQTDISVQVHQMSIERINNHQLKVGFLQDYASGNYRETAQPKTLLLIRTGNDWRIAGEWQSTDLPRSATRK